LFRFEKLTQKAQEAVQQAQSIAEKNQLLKRQIELLDKSQEYRCCPAGSAPTTAPK